MLLIAAHHHQVAHKHDCTHYTVNHEQRQSDDRDLHATNCLFRLVPLYDMRRIDHTEKPISLQIVLALIRMPYEDGDVFRLFVCVLDALLPIVSQDALACIVLHKRVSLLSTSTPCAMVAVPLAPFHSVFLEPSHSTFPVGLGSRRAAQVASPRESHPRRAAYLRE